MEHQDPRLQQDIFLAVEAVEVILPTPDLPVEVQLVLEVVQQVRLVLELILVMLQSILVVVLEVLIQHPRVQLVVQV
tara:strand:+ start:254 stop:484 length:231 start_codon:yes stop_codon:yes gene_type:complete